MTSTFINLADYKNVSSFGEDVYLFNDENGVRCLLSSDVMNGVSQPRQIYFKHQNYEEVFKERWLKVGGVFDPQKLVVPDADIDTMLHSDDYQLYMLIASEYPFPIHLLRGDGFHVVAPFHIDQYILNERKYMLDDFIEHLMDRKKIWIASEISWDKYIYLEMPFKREDDDKLSGIIEDFNLNQNCEGYDRDSCEAFSCIVDLTQEEIIQVRDYGVRYNARTLTDEEKKHELYGIEKFIAYEILGGKNFRIPCPEEIKRRFKR